MVQDEQPNRVPKYFLVLFLPFEALRHIGEQHFPIDKRWEVFDQTCSDSGHINVHLVFHDFLSKLNE